MLFAFALFAPPGLTPETASNPETITLVWGTNWPHPNAETIPDDAALYGTGWDGDVVIRAHADGEHVRVVP